MNIVVSVPVNTHYLATFNGEAEVIQNRLASLLSFVCHVSKLYSTVCGPVTGLSRFVEILLEPSSEKLERNFLYYIYILDHRAQTVKQICDCGEELGDCRHCHINVD